MKPKVSILRKKPGSAAIVENYYLTDLLVLVTRKSRLFLFIPAAEEKTPGRKPGTHTPGGSIF